LRTVVLILLCVFVPYTGHVARALNVIPVHNACMEFLDGIRADGRLIMTADIWTRNVWIVLA